LRGIFNQTNINSIVGFFGILVGIIGIVLTVPKDERLAYWDKISIYWNENISVFVIIFSILFILLIWTTSKSKNEVVKPKKKEIEEIKKFSESLPVSLFYLSNRERQRRELRKIINQLEETRHLKQRPLVCLLYGDEHQAHDQFVKCVVLDMLKKSYDCTAVEPKSLQGGFSDFSCFDELHDVILESLIQLYPTENTKESIAKRLAETNQPVILCAEFYTQYCENTNSDEFIKKGFLEFWKDWPSLENNFSNHRLFVFLFIYYRDRTGLKFREAKIKRNFLKTLEELKKSHNAILFSMFNVNCVVLSELSGIKEADAIKWVRIFQDHPACENISIARIREEIRQLYKKQAVKGRIPMEKLSESLRQIILRIKLENV